VRAREEGTRRRGPFQLLGRVIGRGGVDEQEVEQGNGVIQVRIQGLFITYPAPLLSVKAFLFGGE